MTTESIHTEYITESFKHTGSTVADNKRLSVYIAGPMANIEHYNFPAFNQAEKKLESSKIFRKIINPAKLDQNDRALDSTIELTDEERKTIIIRDLKLLVECDSIFMLEGWEDSKGAQVEHALARYLNLKIFYQSRAGSV